MNRLEHAIDASRARRISSWRWFHPGFCTSLGWQDGLKDLRGILLAQRHQQDGSVSRVRPRSWLRSSGISHAAQVSVLHDPSALTQSRTMLATAARVLLGHARARLPGARWSARCRELGPGRCAAARCRRRPPRAVAIGRCSGGHSASAALNRRTHQAVSTISRATRARAGGCGALRARHVEELQSCCHRGSTSGLPSGFDA